MLEKLDAFRGHLKEVAGAHKEMEKCVNFYPIANAHNLIKKWSITLVF